MGSGRVRGEATSYTETRALHNMTHHRVTLPWSLGWPMSLDVLCVLHITRITQHYTSQSNITLVTGMILSRCCDDPGHQCLVFSRCCDDPGWPGHQSLMCCVCCIFVRWAFITRSGDLDTGTRHTPPPQHNQSQTNGTLETHEQTAAPVHLSNGLTEV